MTAISPDGATRWVVVLADSAAGAAAPPGVDGRSYALAMCEDVLELVADLSIVTAAVLCLSHDDPAWVADVTTLTWPGTVVEQAQADEPGEAVLEALALAQRHGVDAAAVLAADAPDLPGLLLGKLFRALGSAEVAVSAADGGGLVALASRLPGPPWLTGELAALEGDALVSQGPSQRLAVGPSWHRLRSAGDVRRLDPGLEGWASTRALLTAPARA
ncbi:hypothetical protein acdb102_02830 [Acidothermaceae bacterium B102]|nr:hypothetical protein acdb102_02830 [Acidothermaceae bacterium B102]